MSDQWYYRMFGEEFGPMPLEKLKELAERGTIQALDQVRSNGADWIAAATVDELGLSTSERHGALAVATDISDFDIAPTENGTRSFSDNAVPTSISDFEISTTQTAADEWFCLVGDNELGPLSFEELLKFAEHEQLCADDQVKMGTSGKWRRAGSIGRLMAALPYKSVEKKIVPGGSKPNLDTVNVETRTPRPAAAPPTPVTIRAPAAVAVPDPNATYRVAYEQAKAMVMESMLAQADAAFKASETQAQSQISWATAPNVDRYWWGWAGGVEFGPVEFAQVFGLAKSGQLKPSDFVRNGANGQFVPSSGVPGLFKALELIAKATEARTLAKAQAQAAAALVAPPTTAPTALLKAAEKSLAAEQAAKSNPAIPLQSSTPLPKSNPAMDTVRQQPRASLDTSERAVETPNRSESYGASSPESAAETDRSNYGSPSMSGGFSSTSSMSSYGYGASKPAAAPYKPSARKSAAASSTWLSDTLESLKEPKAIGSICAIAFVLLMVGWQFLPKNRADDIKKYQALKQLLDEVKSKRTSAPAELTALQQKLTKIGKEIATELKDKASRDEPAKQCLLWAARDEIPRLVQAGLGAESPAEQTLTNRLKDAAYELGLEKRPPVDLTQLAARNDD